MSDIFSYCLQDSRKFNPFEASVPFYLPPENVRKQKFFWDSQGL